MTMAVARRREGEDHLCTSCSACDALLPVRTPAPGTTLLELRCPRCGTLDVYHVNTLRQFSSGRLVRP